MTRDVTPAELAGMIAPILGEALVAFDVDGVLAPIVAHADDARLSPGVVEALGRLASWSQVVIVSGRSLDDLERLFRFAPPIDVIGSHGLERRGHDPLMLSDAERFVLDQVTVLGERAVTAAGEGAWLELKPASVVVHVRSADSARALQAVEAVVRFARVIEGAQVKLGHQVVELLARPASKGAAIASLRRPGQPVVFLGDDVTDESVFAVMGDGDVATKVGPGDTAAEFRLGDPDDVAALLTLVASG